MTKNKWRTLCVTSLVILAPILYGVSVYGQLPARMVTHWGANNQPNGWMPKALMVFGLPVLMLVFHLIAVGTTYYSDRHVQMPQRMERFVAWIFPVITLVAYVTTIRYGLGDHINTRLWAMSLIAVILVVMGNYLPTVPAESASRLTFGLHLPWRVTNRAGAQKTLRVLGYFYVASGVVMLLSLFFSPNVSWAALILFLLGQPVILGLSYRWTTRK